MKDNTNQILRENGKLHSLEFSLTIGCKLNCYYCPQKLLLDNYREKGNSEKRVLKFEDFKIALNKVETGSTISFCGMSEPFANRECAKMVAYAYQKGYKVALLTTLVGMTLEDFDIIKNVEFDDFVLHIPDQEGNSKFVITEEYLELLKRAEKEIKIKYYSCHGTVHEQVKELINKDLLVSSQMQNRAGNLEYEELPKKEVKERKLCYHGNAKESFGFEPVMFPDGTVVLCCMDYGMKHILGNLLTQDVSELLTSKAYCGYERAMLGEEKDYLCNACPYTTEYQQVPAVRLKNFVKEFKNGQNDRKMLCEKYYLKEDEQNLQLLEAIATKKIFVFLDLENYLEITIFHFYGMKELVLICFQIISRNIGTQNVKEFHVFNQIN